MIYYVYMKMLIMRYNFIFFKIEKLFICIICYKYLLYFINMFIQDIHANNLDTINHTYAIDYPILFKQVIYGIILNKDILNANKSINIKIGMNDDYYKSYIPCDKAINTIIEEFKNIGYLIEPNYVEESLNYMNININVLYIRIKKIEA